MLHDLNPGCFYDLTNIERSESKIFLVTYRIDGVEASEQNPDFFVKLCCMFILSFSDYSFSDDYNKIRRE